MKKLSNLVLACALLLALPSSVEAGISRYNLHIEYPYGMTSDWLKESTGYLYKEPKIADVGDKRTNTRASHKEAVNNDIKTFDLPRLKKTIRNTHISNELRFKAAENLFQHPSATSKMKVKAFLSFLAGKKLPEEHKRTAVDRIKKHKKAAFKLALKRKTKTGFRFTIARIFPIARHEIYSSIKDDASIEDGKRKRAKKLLGELDPRHRRVNTM